MRVAVNGQETETAAETLHALRAQHHPGGGELVTIVDGFATADDLPLREGMEVAFIEKGVLPPREQLESMMAARHTPGVHKRVKAARVAVAGLGGLGSSIALSLARTGVGQLHLVDFDIVEPSNLNRQQYRVCHLGMAKTDALRGAIAEVNPFVEVVTDTVRVTPDNVQALFAGDDILCEAFDNPDSKAMLVDAALRLFPHKPVVAASGMAGTGSSNSICTRRVGGRLYLCGDGETAAQPGCGLMAPRVGVCAGHQANMILRLILGEEDA